MRVTNSSIVFGKLSSFVVAVPPGRTIMSGIAEQSDDPYAVKIYDLRQKRFNTFKTGEVITQDTPSNLQGLLENLSVYEMGLLTCSEI